MEYTVETLDTYIQGQRLPVKRADALNRLRKNKDFKELITEGYLQNEVLRLTSLLSTPNFETNDGLVKRLEAISLFAQFLQTIEQEADIAKNQIATAEEAREELLEGGR